jgi:hypothetical protein
LYKCPHCETEQEVFVIEAPAVVETLCMVYAEVTADDFNEKNITKEPFGIRSLINFRLDDVVERVDNDIDHHHLEFEHEGTMFFCSNCQGELSKELVIPDA